MGKINKKGTTSGLRIEFDRQKRVDYVTGFKKRKDERRVAAKVIIKKEKAEERHEIKLEKIKNRKRIEEQYEEIRKCMRMEDSEDDAEEEGAANQEKATAAEVAEASS
jgi:ribosomal RNA-processing protein 17